MHFLTFMFTAFYVDLNGVCNEIFHSIWTFMDMYTFGFFFCFSVRMNGIEIAEFILVEVNLSTELIR